MEEVADWRALQSKYTVLKLNRENDFMTKILEGESEHQKLI